MCSWIWWWVKELIIFCGQTLGKVLRLGCLKKKSWCHNSNPIFPGCLPTNGTTEPETWESSSLPLPLILATLANSPQQVMLDLPKKYTSRPSLFPTCNMPVPSRPMISGPDHSAVVSLPGLIYSTSALSSIQQKFKVIFLNINSISSLKSFNDFSPTLRFKFLHEVAPASFSPSSHLHPHCNHLPDPVA